MAKATDITVTVADAARGSQELAEALVKAGKYDELVAKVREALEHSPDTFVGRIKLEELRALV